MSRHRSIGRLGGPVQSGLLLGAAIALAGCSSARKAPELSGSAGPSRVLITLQPKGPGRFEARYAVDGDVQILPFAQQADRFRSGRWKPTDPAFEVDEVDGREGLFRKDRARFREGWIEVPAEAPDLSHSYAFSLAFSDGSFALHTSHFLVQGNLPTRFELLPGQGETVAIDGFFSAGPMGWESPPNLETAGSYAYFGKIPMRRLGAFDALLDPALRPGLRKLVEKTVPEAISRISSSTGVLPRKRIFVLIARSPKKRERHRFVGAAGDRWISVDLQGKDWDVVTSQAKEKLFKVLAHELAHLWTAQEGADQKRTAWMNEGGADYFADRIAFDAGVIKKARFRKKILEALDACSRFFAGARAGVDPSTLGDGTFSYRCGMTTHTIIDVLLRVNGRERGIFGLWGDLIRASKETGHPFDATDYFATARRLLPSEAHESLQQVDDLEKVMNGTSPRPVRILAGFRALF